MMLEAPIVEASTDLNLPSKPEPGVMRPSQYLPLLRAFINVVEAEGMPVTVDLNANHPVVHADLTPIMEEKPKPDFSHLFDNAPPERRVPLSLPTNEELATLFDEDTLAQETHQQAAVIDAAKPVEVVTQKMSIRERWQQFRENQREARYPKPPRKTLTRAIGAVAAVGLLVGGGIFVKTSAPEASAQREATPAIASSVHEVAQSSTATTTTPVTEQAAPQLTQEQTKAVITIATGRYVFGLTHTELNSVQADQEFMATVSYATMVQGTSSLQG